MGMTARYQRLPLETLASLRACPRLVENFLMPERVVELDGKRYSIPAFSLDVVRALPTRRRQLKALRWQRRIGNLTPFMETASSRTMPPQPRARTLDIGKEWHGLHYLMCRSRRKMKGPLGMAVLGGHPFGPNLGYGRPRFLVPSEVKMVSRALSRCTRETLRRGFEPSQMTRQHVYPPGGWVFEPDDRDSARLALQDLLIAFGAVNTYFRKAARAEQAMLLFLV